MNRRDVLKVAMIGAAGAVVGLQPAITRETTVAESLSFQSFIADEEYAGVPSGSYHTCALIVDRTDTTITVQTYGGSDPIFVEDGVVSIRNIVRSDGNLFLRQTWLTVHNYRPNNDGTQTWDIKLLGGDISDVVVQNIAYHYGPVSDYEDASVQEVTGSSGWRL